jgi:hypothetical protein
MSLTSTLRNIQKKLLRKAKLPVKPVHSPSRPCTRTICLAQSNGPLNSRSATARCIWSCSLTGLNLSARAVIRRQRKRLPFRSSTGVAMNALQMTVIRVRKRRDRELLSLHTLSGLHTAPRTHALGRSAAGAPFPHPRKLLCEVPSCRAL